MPPEERAVQPVRPRLLLFIAPHNYPARNVVAATLAWLASRADSFFEVYYDAPALGRHLGSDPRLDAHAGGDDVPVAMLTGGLVTGGRHHEALLLSLLRFETTVVSCGSLIFAGALAALAADGRARVIEFSPDEPIALYQWAFEHFQEPWPQDGFLVDREPSAGLKGIDAYVYPEIFYPQRLGLESSLEDVDLLEMQRHGLRRLFAAGASPKRQNELRSLGFDLIDSGLITEGDDYGRVTRRIADRWTAERQGWIVGDPTLVSYWLPAACRERRVAVYSIPQSAILDQLASSIQSNATMPVLGRQAEDSDFFTLSRLGQSFHVVDPCRPALPVLTDVPAAWPAPKAKLESDDPTDRELVDWADEGRILTSLVFWTGMIREVENLYALTDLLALTGLRAGLVVTAQTFAWRPSPLDLLLVPTANGGLHPHVELLMGSAGDGVSIESLLGPESLAEHLAAAARELDRLNVPAALRPRGWWATMDSPLLPRQRGNRVPPVRLQGSAPFKLQIRFNRSATAATAAAGLAGPSRNGHRASLRSRVGRAVRSSNLDRLFLPYRPFEHFAPGDLNPALAKVVKAAGFEYMMTKSAFGQGPTVAYQDDGFVAINYTAGQWDGWTPFETVNDLMDLRTAERRLLASGRPGWLLGQIDSCLWTFSGELWQRAEKLNRIAEFVAKGGASRKLINVRPAVLARYARLVAERTPKLQTVPRA